MFDSRTHGHIFGAAGINVHQCTPLNRNSIVRSSQSRSDRRLHGVIGAMEPGGLAVSIVGLAGLFSLCLDVIEKVEKYKDFGTDSRTLIAQFEADKLRFKRWGEKVGFKNQKL